MSKVQVSTNSLFCKIFFYNFCFCTCTAFDNINQKVCISRINFSSFWFKNFIHVRIKEQGSFKCFCKSWIILTFWKALNKFREEEKLFCRIECSNDIFYIVVIAAGFSTNRSVYHRKKGGRHKLNFCTALKNWSCKGSNIRNYTASNSNKHIFSCKACFYSVTYNS